MDTQGGHLGIGAFASAFGDRERTPDSIEDFAALCSAKGLSLNLSTMGCGTFWQMTQPLETYIAQCVADTLAASGVSPKAVNHIVFSTMDNNLRHLDQDISRTILDRLELTGCIPSLISLQQCASSLAALDFARKLFADESVQHVIVVAFDFVVADRDRIQSFALFGDAVTSCMLSRGDAAGLSLLSYAVKLDFAGLQGRDNFESRKQVAVAALGEAFKAGGTRLEEMEKCFSTNFYKPVALFSAGVCGINRTRLYIDSLSSRAHCGNCDWMINLMHYRQHIGMAPGKKFLVQSFAPGFFACGVLAAPA